MTEHFKAPEKILLSEEEIANLSDAHFKTVVIKMLTKLFESVRKPDEKMKPMLRETKENVRGTNSDGKETGIQIKIPSYLASDFSLFLLPSCLSVSIPFFPPSLLLYPPFSFSHV